MCPDSGLSPEDDIQQALHQAQNPTPMESQHPEPAAGEVMAHAQGSCPILGMRYAMAKCGFMAEKYPWQTTAALVLTTACGWICAYFGATLLVGLVLFAIFSEE
jgi:predicted RNA-binding Zn-ribbon protein involved in translation (DUF1610 family)